MWSAEIYLHRHTHKTSVSTVRDITNTYCWGKINFDVTEWGYVVNTPYIHYSLQSGWFSKVLTLQTEERLTVGLDPSVHSAVSVLLLNCLFLSYSFNYGEQEVKESRPPRPYTHTPYLLQRTPHTAMYRHTHKYTKLSPVTSKIHYERQTGTNRNVMSI